MRQAIHIACIFFAISASAVSSAPYGDQGDAISDAGADFSSRLIESDGPEQPADPTLIAPRAVLDAISVAMGEPPRIMRPAAKTASRPDCALVCEATEYSLESGIVTKPDVFTILFAADSVAE